MRTTCSAGDSVLRIEHDLSVSTAGHTVINEKVRHNRHRVLRTEADYLGRRTGSGCMSPNAVRGRAAVGSLVRQQSFGTDVSRMVSRGVRQCLRVHQGRQSACVAKRCRCLVQRFHTFARLQGHLSGQLQEQSMIIGSLRLQLLDMCARICTHGIQGRDNSCLILRRTRSPTLWRFVLLRRVVRKLASGKREYKDKRRGSHVLCQMRAHSRVPALLIALDFGFDQIESVDTELELFGHAAKERSDGPELKLIE